MKLSSLLTDDRGCPVAVSVFEGNTVELTHALGQIAFRRFDDDMTMVVHLTPGMTTPMKAVTDLRKDIQPYPSVFGVTIDGFSSVSPGSHMVKCTSELDS